MINVTLCGLYKNKIVPLSLDVNRKVSTTNNISLNKPVATADFKVLLFGVEKNETIPIAVDEEGRLIL